MKNEESRTAIEERYGLLQLASTRGQNVIVQLTGNQLLFQILCFREDADVVRYIKTELPIEGVFDHLLALLGAEEKSHRRIVTGLHFVFFPVGDIRVELAEVLVREGLILEFDNQGEVADSVVENQVRVVVIVIDDDSLLAGFEAHSLAEFEEELLQVFDECVFEVGFGHNILRLQTEEFEGVGRSDLQLCRVASVLIRGQAFLWIHAQSDADMQVRSYLAAQFSDRPGAAHTFLLIEVTHQRIVNGQKFPDV